MFQSGNQNQDQYQAYQPMVYGIKNRKLAKSEILGTYQESWQYQNRYYWLCIVLDISKSNMIFMIRIDIG